MSELIGNWVAHHIPFIEGLALGYAAAHIPELTAILFKQALKVPWIRSAILSDPARSKAIISQIEKELEKDIDQEAAEQSKEKDKDQPKA